MTLDSYPGRVTEPLTLHKYLYAHADPVNNIDPSGQVAMVETGQLTRSIALPMIAPARFLGFALRCVFNTTSSTLAVAMIIAIEGGTIDLNQALCMAKHKPGKWTCTSKCHAVNFGNNPNCPDFYYGTASGKTEQLACAAAEYVARNSALPGTRTRHCNCHNRCSKN